MCKYYYVVSIGSLYFCGVCITYHVCIDAMMEHEEAENTWLFAGLEGSLNSGSLYSSVFNSLVPRINLP